MAARLALVARLLDRDGPADMFAQKATDTNEFPWEYYRLSTQRMLAHGRTAEAIVFARRLRDNRPDDPRAALLLAEAYVEVGRLEDARTIVNEIRARAGQVAQGCGLPPDANRAGTLVALYPQCDGDARIAVPIDDPSIAWADYAIGLYPAAGWDQSFAREAVRYERRLELAMEGERFFDLRRWETAEEVLNDYIAVEQARRPYLGAAAVYTDRHALFPIPHVQIELGRITDPETGEQTDMLVQNLGW